MSDPRNIFEQQEREIAALKLSRARWRMVAVMGWTLVLGIIAALVAGGGR